MGVTTPVLIDTMLVSLDFMLGNRVQTHPISSSLHQAITTLSQEFMSLSSKVQFYFIFLLLQKGLSSLPSLTNVEAVFMFKS